LGGKSAVAISRKKSTLRSSCGIAAQDNRRRTQWFALTLKQGDVQRGFQSLHASAQQGLRDPQFLRCPAE
jgi:hypothetical protein